MSPRSIRRQTTYKYINHSLFTTYFERWEKWFLFIFILWLKVCIFVMADNKESFLIEATLTSQFSTQFDIRHCSLILERSHLAKIQPPVRWWCQDNASQEFLYRGKACPHHWWELRPEVQGHRKESQSLPCPHSACERISWAGQPQFWSSLRPLGDRQLFSGTRKKGFVLLGIFFGWLRFVNKLGPKWRI